MFSKKRRTGDCVCTRIAIARWISRTTWPHVLLIMLVMIAPAECRTITVDPGGSYDYITIQKGIDAATNGDTVLVMPSSYIVHEPISFKGKAIVVKSQDGPGTTTIQMTPPLYNPDRGSVVVFENGEGPGSILMGFTVTGGVGTRDTQYPQYYWGGGVLCFKSSPTIKGNIIINNDLPTGTGSTYGLGGGIGCYDSGATIVGNVIKNNDAYIGGGMYIYRGTVSAGSNIISGNMAVWGGGACLQPWECIINFSNNTLVANTATGGGHVWASANSRISNNIMVNGTGTYGGGICWYRLGPLKQSPLAYNNIYGNTGGNYYGIEDQTGMNGNISKDPLFTNPGNQDYHLQAVSPCINSGDPAFVLGPNDVDIDGDIRLWGHRVDIGVDEYTGRVRPSADAGLDQFLKGLPASVLLDGSDAYFYDSNDIKKFNWTQSRGPAVTLNDANALKPLFFPPERGIYVFELQVADSFAESLPDDVIVVVGNERIPIADAGLPRYAGTEPVKLDGTGSYDPDKSGPLRYAWRQLSGPSLTIVDSNSATPTISGFTQTNAIQECKFELVVNDGDYNSLPDVAEVKIVRSFGSVTFDLENDSFDPRKPTIIYFSGGDCVIGYPSIWGSNDWSAVANIIGFPYGYSPDNEPHTDIRRYCRYGDMILAYLSSVAPDYEMPIQTMGWSTGGQPAVDVAAYLNLTIEDRRYAVNRMAALDVGCRDYVFDVNQWLAYPVDGEQCWTDFYCSYYPSISAGGFLCVGSSLNHDDVRNWYKNSLTISDMNVFNGGVVGGAYWSVVGPGRNLQLNYKAPAYYYSWSGGATSGSMSLYNEALYPGKLPEPVTLLEPNYVAESGGYLLTCEESENAIGYELLIGSDPSRVMDYQVISDTPSPPNDVVTTLPLKGTWWTIRARDKYESTIYADPIYIEPAFDILDFSHNGKVDFEDFAIIARFWHQNEPYVDIAPRPNGDGIVDYKDLSVFAENWLQVTKILLLLSNIIKEF